VAGPGRPYTQRVYAVVTGAAGFIGSNLVDGLLAGGHRVLGVDCFSDYYDPALKRRNVAGFRDHPGFELAEQDLRSTDVRALIDGADIVYHQAGQPGVRTSFAAGFEEYCSQNILATQRLLEAAKDAATSQVVFASSSSIYGNSVELPTGEDRLPQPFSPYGVTKLAAEHLCSLYAANWGVPTVALRYFSVYGPRQRPDMAMHRLIRSCIDGTPFPLYGEGHQIRDFTYVGDVVAANLAVPETDPPPGTVVNIAGGTTVSMLEVFDLVGEVVGSPVVVDRRPAQAGDVARTGGRAEMARKLLGWEPVVSLREGLGRQVEDLQRRMAAS
jgi:UDP-glucuronate 4-epimerase